MPTDTKTKAKKPKKPTALVAAEIAELEAKTRKLIAEAESAESQALVLAMEAAEHEREYESVQASDARHHIYHYGEPVNSMSARNCIANLSRWSRLDPGCDITVVFNSPGGSVIEGMALWDFLTSLSKRGGGRHKLTTVCRGYAASMAGILLQAGDVRVIGRESYLMIHEISAGTGGKIGEMKDDVKFYDKICERVVDIFVTRSGKKCDRETFVKNWQRIDWWLDSKQALKLGFVDEIL